MDLHVPLGRLTRMGILLGLVALFGIGLLSFLLFDRFGGE